MEIRRDGATVESHDLGHNLMVNTGLNHIAALLENESAVTGMGWMGLGSGTAAAAAGDTALGTELGRVALTSKTRTANAVEYEATFPAGTATGAVTEAAIFNAVAAGDMLARIVFPVMNKAPAAEFVYYWTVTVSDDGV
jgi:hypothetical protein